MSDAEKNEALLWRSFQRFDRMEARYVGAANEIVRLKEICQEVHDRLLRGDDDRELLALLEKAWKGQND